MRIKFLIFIQKILLRLIVYFSFPLTKRIKNIRIKLFNINKLSTFSINISKIISNGTFVDGFGGGVCQVSTTLYNAALLSGLEIMEVHNHSLPVSYIEPSFDAIL